MRKKIEKKMRKKKVSLITYVIKPTFSPEGVKPCFQDSVSLLLCFHPFFV